MNAVRIDNRVINLDNVAYIDLNPYEPMSDKVGITFVGGSREVYDLTLEGHEAHQFRQWILAQTNDITLIPFRKAE